VIVAPGARALMSLAKPKTFRNRRRGAPDVAPVTETPAFRIFT
jgi:hypothetical protein